MVSFSRHRELLAKVVLQNIHSTATSHTVAVPKQSAKIGQDHVAVAMFRKRGAVSHGLNVVDAKLKD